MDLNLFKILTIVVAIACLFKIGYMVKFIMVDRCMNNTKSKRAVFLYGFLALAFVCMYFYYINSNNSQWSLLPLVFVCMSLDGMATVCGSNKG